MDYLEKINLKPDLIEKIREYGLTMMSLGAESQKVSESNHRKADELCGKADYLLDEIINTINDKLKVID